METNTEEEYQYEATEGFSLPSSLKSGFDFLPKKDIMSIVMKRRLGGCESSGSESDASLSPVKKPKTSHNTYIDESNQRSASQNIIEENQSADISKIQDKKSPSPAIPNNFILAGSLEGFNVSNFACFNSENDDNEAEYCSLGISDSNIDEKTESDAGFKYVLENENLVDGERGYLNDQKDDNVHVTKGTTHNSKELKLIQADSYANIEQKNKESHSPLEVQSKNSNDTLDNGDLIDLKIQNEVDHKKSENLSNRSDVSKYEIHDKDRLTLTNSNSENINVLKKIEIEAKNESIQSTNIFRNKKDHDDVIEYNFCTDSIPSESELPDCSNNGSEKVQNQIDEVDSLNANIVKQPSSKPSGKKSRKQKMPMRLATNEIKFDYNISMNEDQSTEEQSDKERKQFEPKRVGKEQSEFDYLDEDSDDYDIEGTFNDSSNLLQFWDKSSKVQQNEIEKENENSEQSENSNDKNLLNTKKGLNDLDSLNEKSDNVSENKLTDKNETQNFSLPTGLPFNFQDPFMSYSNMFQPHLTNDLAIEKLLEQNQTNLTENLEVVKKLREIRFNRYRKITVSEKREIAEYAKQHSVSSAALHYGVSKSAVSMWTRIDFSDMDDSSGRRKKNCMIGNPKFEELVQRVRDEKANKFKHLSKQDKIDVSRYAKLVGVREMSRCLNIALGTVSGWMRQFPYSVKQSNKEEGESESSNLSDSLQDSNSVDKQMKDSNKSQNERSETDDPLVDTDQKIIIKTEPIEEDDYQNGLDEIESNQIKSENSVTDHEIKIERTDEDSQQSVSNQNDENVTETGNSKINKDKADEIDNLIAVTYEKPDVDKCFEDAKEMIRGSPLENDAFFEKLFRRVVECRADKYKSLKASEKLEVVRFAKRIGVRRIAKILGLATGTLSGWSTKYQAHLGLTSDVLIDMNQSGQLSDFDSSLDVSQTTESDSQSTPFLVSPASSMLDNPERAEVTAVKLILKDRFDYLKGKIEVARKVKFKNITHDEKIEVVKCTKLAGIRPTARVLNMPIGTLSGWITKYTGDLPPVYQEECDRLDGQAIHKPTQSTYSTPGSQAYFYDLMNSQWPGLKHLPSLYSSSGMNNSFQNGNYNSNMNMFNGLGNDSRFGHGMSTENNDSQPENNGDSQFEDSAKETDIYTKLEDNAMYVVRKSNMDLFNPTVPSDYRGMASGSFVYNNTQNVNAHTKYTNDSDAGFEEEAKSMAAKYLKNFMV